MATNPTKPINAPFKPPQIISLDTEYARRLKPQSKTMAGKKLLFIRKDIDEISASMSRLQDDYDYLLQLEDEKLKQFQALYGTYVEREFQTIITGQNYY